jgi:hypothetical protein
VTPPPGVMLRIMRLSTHILVWRLGMHGVLPRHLLSAFMAWRLGTRKTEMYRSPRREDVLVEWRYSSTHSLTSALESGAWSVSRPGRFTPRERVPGTHWIGGWVGPRAVLDAVVKRKIPSPSRESNLRTPIVYPVA